MKRYRISARHFRQNRHLPKGPFAISFAFFYALAILAINRHFPQIRHFRQNRHFPKGPFVISFQFLFTFWRLSANSAIFAKYAIFAKIATFQRVPLPSHLNFCLQFGDFGNKAPFLSFSPNTPFSPKSPLSKGPLCHLIWIFVYSLAILAINCHFCHFRQIRHFHQNRHFPKGSFAISFEFLFTVWRFWRLSTISAIFANACISGHISDEGETITGAAFGELRNHVMASVLSINPIYYESYNPFHVMSDQIQTLIDTEHITDETSKLENFLKQYFCCKI